MADVNALAARPRGGDRGQLILIGGIVVAFALVALVVLLNTVLFTEIIATKGIGPEIDRAHDHAAIAGDAGAAIVAGENAPAAGHTTWTQVNESVTQGIDRVSDIVQNRSLRRFGGYSNVSVGSTRRGAVLIQNDTRAFTSSGGAPTFILAETTGIRDFTTRVDAAGTANPASSEDRFTVTITGNGGNSWHARVYAPDSSTIKLTTSGGTTCTQSAATTINWTEGTFGDCQFQFAGGSESDLTSPFQVSYENGDNASGTYRLVVSDHESADDDDDDTVRTENFNDPSGTESPRWYPGIYSLVVEATYAEGKTTYETNVRVAPDEPTQTSPAV